jgi:hypothetical protein
VALVSAIRAMMVSPLADTLIARHARKLVPALEAEIHTLGRQHQRHTPR